MTPATRPPTLFIMTSPAAAAILALSPALITEEIGMPRSTYHDQFKILENKGYLVNTHGNTYEFFEKPQPSTVIQDLKKRSPHGLKFEVNTSDGISINQAVSNSTEGNTEINNK